ncbi:hypothetical protein F5Y15DRAFT_58659 [Xylariaceae sp. FL0016]|nr:hypothetical protein F5Y15DRAFT_58659 [Xylariaceae sp. FL0016]
MSPYLPLYLQLVCLHLQPQSFCSILLNSPEAELAHTEDLPVSCEPAGTVHSFSTIPQCPIFTNGTPKHSY